jgi:hypothetical protein
MADETELRLKITRGPPFWWEIYRGDDPQWVERKMFGYLIQTEALQDGQAARRRLAKRRMNLPITPLNGREVRESPSPSVRRHSMRPPIEAVLLPFIAVTSTISLGVSSFGGSYSAFSECPIAASTIGLADARAEPLTAFCPRLLSVIMRDKILICAERSVGTEYHFYRVFFVPEN